MKQLFIGAVCIFALAATVLSVSARPKKRYDAKTDSCRILNSGPLEWESLPWGEGGRGFQQVCKSCHNLKNAEGSTFLWSESKTSSGWNRVFAKRRVQCARDGSWNSLTEDQLQMINDYLYSWASNAQDINDSA